MKKLKTISLLNDLLKVRPLTLVALAVLICDILYVNLLFKYPEPPIQENTTVRGIVRDKNLDENDSLKSITVGDTLCYVNKMQDCSDVSIGDTVLIKGSVFAYENAMNFGEFDAKKYNASRKIFCYMYATGVKVVKHRRFSLREIALDLRYKAAKKVNRFCRLENGTINTLLLSDKRNLSASRKDLYTKAGVGHFLVISGLHISAVGAFVYKVLRALGIKRRRACIAAVTLLTAYGLVAGFSVSVIRAVIMYTIRLFADIFKRVYDMLNSLFAAMIISILINPLCILDYGFVYSYMTVFSIAFYYTFLKPDVKGQRTIAGIFRELLRIPVVLCLFMMPVNLYLSFHYSLASIPINALLAPFSGVILLLAALALFGSLLSLAPLAAVFDFLLATVLKALDGLCFAGSSLKGLNFTGRPPVAVIVIYYLLLILYYTHLNSDLVKSVRAVYLFSLLAMVGQNYFLYPELSMLYVGQGECIVLKTSSHKAIMIDCGSSPEKDIAEYKVVPFLNASGITTLEGVFITHTDADHVSGILDLLDTKNNYGIKINRIFLPKVKEQDERYGEILEEASESKIKIGFLENGNDLHNNTFDITVLSPDKRFLTGDSNEDCLVMKMSINGTDILLTGDSSKEVEARYIKEAGGHTDILKVAHHGSQSATSKALLDACSFDMAIISAGIDNKYGHPHTETLMRLQKAGVPYACTAQTGEIDIKFSGRGKYKTEYFMKDN